MSVGGMAGVVRQGVDGPAGGRTPATLPCHSTLTQTPCHPTLTPTPYPNTDTLPPYLDTDTVTLP